MTIGLAGTVAVSEQTRRFGEQEHLRIESTLLDNVSDALRSQHGDQYLHAGWGRGSV
ncbi:hypothetical protein KBZ07_06725 [Cyanobium sp. BA20m-14]|nr:hypothetical protein [Cyanobium sp. BA20m-14]